MLVKVRQKSVVVSFFVSIIAIVLVLGSMNASAVVPYTTERVNLNSSGSQMTSAVDEQRPEISQDGRYVAFVTIANDIVPGDTNGQYDVFVRDLQLGTTVRASVSNTGGQLSQASNAVSLSGDGRYVLFRTTDSGVVSGDTNGSMDVFVRDLLNNTTDRVSVSSSGGQGNDTSYGGDISADGRYVAFTSKASNLVSGDTNSKTDVFVRDRKLNTTTLLSKNSVGNSANNNSSYGVSISCDGAYVAFASDATDLVSNDTNGYTDMFLVDRINSNSITNITAGGNYSTNSPAEISCSGSKVIYLSQASNLVPNDTNATYDIFAYDMVSGATQRVNVDSSGNQTVYATTISNLYPGGIDFSGRYVVFSGLWDDMISGDTNGRYDVFIRDLKEGTTQIISKRDSANQSTGNSSNPSISLDGREVIYTSDDTGLVAGDTNGVRDIFVSKTGI